LAILLCPNCPEVPENLFWSEADLDAGASNASGLPLPGHLRGRYRKLRAQAVAFALFGGAFIFSGAFSLFVGLFSLFDGAFKCLFLLQLFSRALQAVGQ